MVSGSPAQTQAQASLSPTSSPTTISPRSLPRADIYGNFEVSFGIEFEFYPRSIQDHHHTWIPPEWGHQPDPTAGEEISTPVMILDASNPIRFWKSYMRCRKRIFWDLREYSVRNNCLNIYASRYGRFGSMGGHIHVATPNRLDPVTATMAATYIKSILPLTAFLAQFDIWSEYSRRIYRNIRGDGYSVILPAGRYITSSHYGMISYNPIGTVEVRIQDSAPPQVLVPIAYIYATLVASALKKQERAPLDYLRMTDNVHEYELRYALERRLKMSKIVIRWIALCRGDILLPKDVAFLVWLALNRVAPVDYARDVGATRFYRACAYSDRSRKKYADSFLVVVRLILPYVRSQKLRDVYRMFVRKFGRRVTIYTSEILRFYAEVTSDKEERRVISVFLEGNKAAARNKLLERCIEMAYRERWGYELTVNVRRIRGREDAEWIGNIVGMTAEEVIEDRDRFYIVERRRTGERVGVIRVTWRDGIVRGVWFTQQLTEREMNDMYMVLEEHAAWFSRAVREWLEENEPGTSR